MAVRPVFTVSPGPERCVRENIEFKFFSGFSIEQKRRSINSLHREYLNINPGKRVLEISSKSESRLSVMLSAFNLMTRSENGKVFSVESAFQAGKVFESGGPYVDLLDVPSVVAKRDTRLKNSGRVIAFEFDGKRFETEPKTCFYNWLYINALHLHKEFNALLLNYDAFTDIEFNPQKPLNCQAEAAAIYVSLVKQGLLEKALKDVESFKRIVYYGSVS